MTPRHVLDVGSELRAVSATQQRFKDAQQKMERNHWRRRQAESHHGQLFQVAHDAVLMLDVGTPGRGGGRFRRPRAVGQPGLRGPRRGGRLRRRLHTGPLSMDGTDVWPLPGQALSTMSAAFAAFADVAPLLKEREASARRTTALVEQIRSLSG